MSAPAVAVSPNGKKFAAAWMDKRTGKDDPDVYWAVATSASFGADLPLADDVKGVQNHPTIAIAKDGTVWVAWEDSRSGQFRIRGRSSAKGDKDRQLSDDGDGAATWPSLAANAGLVALVYEADQGGQECVVFRLIE